jgi:uncharacterized protein
MTQSSCSENIFKAIQALIIFVKNPVPGKVKTRLARSIGDEPAAEVYRQLLLHTKSITQQLKVDKLVYYADDIAENDLWESSAYQKRQQQGENLGERMASAFAACFDAGYRQVVIIGSDCAEITAAHVEQAFAALNTNDVVIGPATDGGYYLLGMKKLNQRLFENIPWSTDAVMSSTLQKVNELGLNYLLIETLSDIDDLEAYQKMKMQDTFDRMG